MEAVSHNEEDDEVFGAPKPSRTDWYVSWELERANTVEPNESYVEDVPSLD